MSLDQELVAEDRAVVAILEAAGAADAAGLDGDARQLREQANLLTVDLWAQPLESMVMRESGATRLCSGPVPE